MTEKSIQYILVYTNKPFKLFKTIYNLMTPEKSSFSRSRTINAIGLAVCVSLLGDLALFAALPVKADIVGISLTQVGILLGIHRLIRIPGNSIGATFINRFRRKPYFLAGMFFAMVSTAGYGWVSGFWFFILTRLLWGIAWILIYIASMTMLMDVTTPENRGKWSGVYNTWYLVGIAGGSIVGGTLTDTIGFHAAMFWCAGITALGMLVLWVWVPETRILEQPRDDEQILVSSHWKNILQTWVKMGRHLRTIPGVLPVVGIYMAHQFVGEGVAISTFTLLLKDRFGAHLSWGMMDFGIISLGGSLIALRYILSAFISPIVGRFSDHKYGRRGIVYIGIVAGITSFLLIGFGHSLWVIGLGIVVNALSGSALAVVLVAILGDISPSGREGEIIGLYATAGDIGSASGPLFAYWVLAFLNLPSVYLVCSLLFVGCLFMARIIKGRPAQSSVPLP